MGLRSFVLEDVGNQPLRSNNKSARFDVVGKRLADDIECHGIVGQSLALRKVMHMVERVAVGDSTVLLLGETAPRVRPIRARRWSPSYM
jgi:transcriptional regulator with GAF, ATPase, and Fis domain